MLHFHKAASRKYINIIISNLFANVYIYNERVCVATMTRKSSKRTRGRTRLKMDPVHIKVAPDLFYFVTKILLCSTKFAIKTYMQNCLLSF